MPAGPSSATSSSLYRVVSSSLRTPRSTHVISAFSTAALSTLISAASAATPHVSIDTVNLPVSVHFTKEEPIPLVEKSSMTAASIGGTSALTVRSCNSISREIVPRCGNQYNFLSGLNVWNSPAYASWMLVPFVRVYCDLVQARCGTYSLNCPGMLKLPVCNGGQKCRDTTVGCRGSLDNL